MHFFAYPAGAFRPVPMAVAPMLVSQRTCWMRSSAWTSPESVAAKASNSWPSVMGTASWSCVRPILRIFENSLPLRRNDAMSSFIAATSSMLPRAMPTWRDVGYASLVDWEPLTWSCGSQYLYSPFLWPISSRARLAMTSLAFMLVDVPAPPWKTSSRNSSWSFPSMISWQAFSIPVRISLENCLQS